MGREGRPFFVFQCPAPALRCRAAAFPGHGRGGACGKGTRCRFCVCVAAHLSSQRPARRRRIWPRVGGSPLRWIRYRKRLYHIHARPCRCGLRANGEERKKTKKWRTERGERIHGSGAARGFASCCAVSPFTLPSLTRRINKPIRRNEPTVSAAPRRKWEPPATASTYSSGKPPSAAASASPAPWSGSSP